MDGGDANVRYGGVVHLYRANIHGQLEGFTYSNWESLRGLAGETRAVPGWAGPVQHRRRSPLLLAPWRLPQLPAARAQRSPPRLHTKCSGRVVRLAGLGRAHHTQRLPAWQGEADGHTAGLNRCLASGCRCLAQRSTGIMFNLRQQAPLLGARCPSLALSSPSLLSFLL